jgi:hypothetical protein
MTDDADDAKLPNGLVELPTEPAAAPALTQAPARRRCVVTLAHCPNWEGEAADYEDAVNQMCAAYGVRRAETDNPIHVAWID